MHRSTCRLPRKHHSLPIMIKFHEISHQISKYSPSLKTHLCRPANVACRDDCARDCTRDTLITVHVSVPPTSRKPPASTRFQKAEPQSGGTGEGFGQPPGDRAATVHLEGSVLDGGAVPHERAPQPGGGPLLHYLGQPVPSEPRWVPGHVHSMVPLRSDLLHSGLQVPTSPRIRTILTLNN